MFYSYDLLCRRKNGKFSIVWLAATNKKKLDRVSCMRVDVSKTCDEIAKVIIAQDSNEPHGSTERSRVRFSLYLSSILMHGTCLVYKQQVEIFCTHLLAVRRSLCQVYVDEYGCLVQGHAKASRKRNDDGSDSDEPSKKRKKRAKKPKAPTAAQEITTQSILAAAVDNSIIAVAPTPATVDIYQPTHLLRDEDIMMPMLDEESNVLNRLLYHGEAICLDEADALIQELNASMIPQKNNEHESHDIAQVQVEELEGPINFEVPEENAICKDQEAVGDKPSDQLIIPAENPELVTKSTEMPVNPAAERVLDTITEPQAPETPSRKNARRSVLDKSVQERPEDEPLAKLRRPPSRRPIFEDLNINLSAKELDIHNLMQESNRMRNRRIQNYSEDLCFRETGHRTAVIELMSRLFIPITNPLLKEMLAARRLMQVSVSEKSRCDQSSRSLSSVDRSRSSRQLATVEEEVEMVPIGETILEENVLYPPAIDVEDPTQLPIEPTMPDLLGETVLPVAELGPTAESIYLVEELDPPVEKTTEAAVEVNVQGLVSIQETLEDLFIVPEPVATGSLTKGKRDREMTDDSSQGSGSSLTRGIDEGLLFDNLAALWRKFNGVAHFQDICVPQKTARKTAARTFAYLLQMQKAKKIHLNQENIMLFGPIEILPPSCVSV